MHSTTSTPTNSKSGRWVIPHSVPVVINVCHDTTRLQLRNPLRSRDIAKTLGEINADKGIPNADELDPVQRLSRYFLETPAEAMVHLVVRLHLSEYPPYAESCTLWS